MVLERLTPKQIEDLKRKLREEEFKKKRLEIAKKNLLDIAKNVRPSLEEINQEEERQKKIRALAARRNRIRQANASHSN